jgi:hypothetical protein
MTDAELAPADLAGDLVAPAALGAAAERFARNTLRKSAQTRRTYLSVYTRFAAHLASLGGVADPPPSAFRADAVGAISTGSRRLGGPRRRSARSAPR